MYNFLFICYKFNMITVPEVVGRIVKRSPFLEEALSLGIVNLSSLARQIKPDVQEGVMKEVQDGAILMALKRLLQSMNEKGYASEKLFARSPDLMVRSNLIEMTFSNSERIIPKKIQFLEQINVRKNYFITFTQGIFETTIIASEELQNSIKEIFKGEKIISQFDHLSALTVKLPKETALVPGAYNFILKALAWEGINVVEVVSTFSEFTIIAHGEDIDRAFAIIKRLF